MQNNDFRLSFPVRKKFQKHDSFDVNVNAQTNTTVTYQEKLDRIIIFSLTKYQVFNRFDQSHIQEPINFIVSHIFTWNISYIFAEPLIFHNQVHTCNKKAHVD